jgi:polyhydroxyalkanoate synthesis repressor PhaR
MPMARARRAATPAPSPEQAAAPSAALPAEDGPRILKKYPNRRLYDTQTSSYITLADVKQMVLDAQHFVVRDAKSSEDLTRSILLQIILEEETGGVPIFSAPMLSQIIRFYGHAMQGLMGSYLEKNLQAFADFQTRFSEQGLPGAPGSELWSQGMMGPYLEQSRKMFQQMQEQMTKQAGALFPGMPGFLPPKR